MALYFEFTQLYGHDEKMLKSDTKWVVKRVLFRHSFSGIGETQIYVPESYLYAFGRFQP